MANTFKVVTNDAMPTSASTPLTLYTVPSSTTTVVLGLILCNVHTTAVTASVKLTSSTAGSNPYTNADVMVAKDVDSGIPIAQMAFATKGGPALFLIVDSAQLL